MPFVAGIIVGIFLTIGVAYMSDASISPSTNGAAHSLDQRPMVNWDVVDHKWQNLTADIRAGWHRLTAH